MDTTLIAQVKQATDRRLYIAFELAQRHWRLAFGDAVGRPRLVTLEAANRVVVKEAIAKARAHFGLDEAAAVVSCYEAGRDGFWLHRWLLECGVENLIVDSGSIEVNRRQRRAKTDRLDAQKLLSMLMRYVGGERRVWTVLHVPTAEQEDARRPHRERERLDRERLAHSNRIRGLLMLHNIRVKTMVERSGANVCRRWARTCRPSCGPRFGVRANGCAWYRSRCVRSKPNARNAWPKPTQCGRRL
jgi:transposase